MPVVSRQSANGRPRACGNSLVGVHAAKQQAAGAKRAIANARRPRSAVMGVRGNAIEDSNALSGI